ncbi:LysM peptidoglycan-binding domain-containing protein [Liquorilactobacillus uvarum]|nr:LysM peptidoglycan-binding domain-containing protein [Liquorilactobacillus uvarum]
MARKKAHRGYKKLIQRFAATIIILIIVFLGWKNENIRARLNSSFSDNKSAQKAEYKKQQSIAKEKYGTVKSSTQVKVESSTGKSSSSVDSSANVKTAESKSNGNEANTKTKAKKTAYGSYTVKYGDSLTIIAEKYNTTTTELMSLNKLDTGTINPGTKLIVPSTKKATSVSSATDSE